MTNPQEKYIFAVDRTKNKSLKNLIKSISKSIGNGKINKNDRIENYSKNENYAEEELSINLKIKPSKVFNDEKAEDEDEEEFEKRKFKWHTEFGIAENLELIRKEFVEFHSLKPVKIFVTGPPGSGKTELSKSISKSYNIHVIKILDILAFGKSLKDELGEEVLKELENEKERVLNDLRQIESTKKEPKEIDPASIKDYLPLATVFKVLKRMLMLNVYRNRGYILDGFPKNYSQAKSCFVKVDEEKPDDDPTKETLISEILPNSVILLSGDSDESLKDRYRNKKENELIDTHYNPKDMDRRLKNYRFDNESKYGDFSCVDFFLQNSVKKLSLNCYKKQNEILESVKVFIERDGSINNYIDSHISSENSFSEHLKTNMVVKEKTTDYKNRVNEFYEKLQKNEVFNYNKEKMEELKAKERNILEEKSQDLRYYLTENVIPILSQGILEICKRCPEDPVDELAKFLMEKSNQVAFNDPSKYKQN